jgi:hypothetical protein
MDKKLEKLIEEHPIPLGMTVFERQEPNPKNVLALMKELMWAVSPKQAKLIKKVMDDYAKQNGITP